MAGFPSANAIHVPMKRATGVVGALLFAISRTSDAAVLRAALAQEADAVAGTSLLQVGASNAGESMDYLLKTLNKFQGFAVASETTIKGRHSEEEARLKAGIDKATDDGVKKSLLLSEAGNTKVLEETSNIFSNMVGFSNNMLHLLKSATKKGYGCDQLQCGLHASCTDTLNGAECVCNEGYVGMGKNCHAPASFLPHRIIQETSGYVKATDMHVTVFDGDKIAIVYRDETKGNAGAMVVGKIRQAGVADLSPPEIFTAPIIGRGFNPQVVGTDGKRIAVTWRDDFKSGTCKVRGAVLGATPIRGADMALSWGPIVEFCNGQAHKMAISAFPNNTIMVVYSDKVTGNNPGDATESFGNSILAQIDEKGLVTISGNNRFLDSAVTRLQVTKIDETRFVLAARASKLVDEMNPQVQTTQEALAMFGELENGNLVFDPNPVNLEPQRGQMWARGLSLIAPNTFAYAYQDGMSMDMKIAVLDIDPTQQPRMKVLQHPQTIVSGFSPYVSMIDMPYSPNDPHTLTYYQSGSNTSMVNLCTWNNGKLSQCEDMQWLEEPLTSVSGANLGGGKSLMVFSSEDGTPYYSVFGLSKQ
eukprot:TRINITY_DN109224_c0_g1_i1.p1 TRINITY_DN109224_c0_g1~~TRINITY_DN109224_c0_g1_i1.p1  ORF type:complete len:629 (+),score=116.38 TRINITY_DN109224_c0_g1_i1:125-1888(+)